jgi:hypothetical protein
MADQLLGTVPRQRQEQIRVSVLQLNGKRVLDLRVFVENDLGQWIPTARGVALGPEDWAQLERILRKLSGKAKTTNGRG